MYIHTCVSGGREEDGSDLGRPRQLLRGAPTKHIDNYMYMYVCIYIYIGMYTHNYI